jgi:hypothetical protein
MPAQSFPIAGPNTPHHDPRIPENAVWTLNCCDEVINH